MIQLYLRGTKADNLWRIKPAIKSGLDIAPNPKLSPRFGENAKQIVLAFDVLRRREKGDEDGKHFCSLCRLGCT